MNNFWKIKTKVKLQLLFPVDNTILPDFTFRKDIEFVAAHYIS